MKCTRAVWLSFFHAILFLLLGPAPPALAESVFYVAPEGNDAWSGTLDSPAADGTDGPFATLHRARDEIRKQKAVGAEGGFTVLVREGLYSLESTFALAVEDSGAADAPIEFRAFSDEKPVLLGGRRIHGFAPHEGKILRADVGGQGFRGVYFRQLFSDGKRQHLARFPNYDPDNPYAGGWSYVDGQEAPLWNTIPGEDKRTLKVKPDDLHDWGQVAEGEVLIFPRYNWWNNILRIASLDRKSQQMTLAGSASYEIRPGDRYYVRNLLEELDAAGEWYLDKSTWTLYFWPPSNAPAADAYAPTLETIVAMDSVSNVTLRGFTIECCEGVAIKLADCTDCRIVGCTIRNVGGRCSSAIPAISVSGGKNCGIVGNDIYEVGSHGVSLAGRPATTPSTPGGQLLRREQLHPPHGRLLQARRGGSCWAA